MMKFVTTVVAAVVLAGVPVAASAAQVNNPAASLSVSPNVRAQTATAKASKLGGGFSVYTIILVAALAGLVVAATTNGDDNDTPASR